MKKIIMMLLVCMMHAPALAAVYEWIDDKGVVNFTDSREKIPAKYQGQAREKDLSQEKNVTIIKDESPPAPRLELAPGPKTYDGRDARWWETTIAALRAEIGSIEKGLPDKRQKLSQLNRRRTLYHKAADRVAINNLGKEIEKDEAKLRELQDKLNELQAQALKAGVPAEAIYR